MTVIFYEPSSRTFGSFCASAKQRGGHTVEILNPQEVFACLKCYFFFSSRRRHTRFDCDWSSDVSLPISRALPTASKTGIPAASACFGRDKNIRERSEERRVGKEGRSRWSPYH